MTDMIVSKDKKYQTKNGYPVEIFKIFPPDQVEDNNVVFGAYYDGKNWFSRTWDINGEYESRDRPSFDLVEIKPKRKISRWLNVYEKGDGSLFYYDHPSKIEADTGAIPQRIACLHFEREFEEGEGLEGGAE